MFMFMSDPHACMLHVSHLSDLLPVDVPVCTRQLYQSHPEAETILIHHTEPILTTSNF
jgi:hypothetical protein